MEKIRNLYRYRVNKIKFKSGQEALYLSGRQSTEQVCQTVRKVFKNTDVYFDYSNPGVLQFRTSKHFGDISKDTMEAYSQLKNLPKLDDQGDGIRSFVGMICALVALDKPIILLDEPEAFLHPPQAYQLGEILAKTVKDSQQIFISTHSVDFLKGLVNASQDTVLSIRTELKKMHASSDNLSGYKSQGREAIEDAEVLKAFDILFDLCSDIGLFIVPVGELESWLVDYGIPKSNHKNKWITNALPKLQNISYDPQKNIWKFVDKLKDYLTS